MENSKNSIIMILAFCCFFVCVGFISKLTEPKVKKAMVVAGIDQPSQSVDSSAFWKKRFLSLKSDLKEFKRRSANPKKYGTKPYKVIDLSKY